MLDFARTASAIGATTSTLEKARLLAEYLATLEDADLRRAANWFSGLAYGRSERKTLNLGWSAIGKAIDALSVYQPEQLSALFLKHSDLGDWAGGRSSASSSRRAVKALRAASARASWCCPRSWRLPPGPSGCWWR